MRKLSLSELNRVTLEEFKQQPKTPLIIVLDNVRSALNVGSAFRTADAFALEKIYLCGITATPPHREILKTAIGASESVDWAYAKETTSIVQSLKDAGYQIFAVEQTTESISLEILDLQPDGKYALVFGNEVGGVSDSVLELVDECVEVPQFGTKHSLNVAVCVGIVSWAFFRQLKFS